MRDISYLTDNYTEQIKRINELNAPLNFVFVTDMHNRLSYMVREERQGKYELGIETIESIRYILQRCPGISMVVCGGDTINDYFPTGEEIRNSVQEVMDAFYTLPVPVHYCIGNHDDGLATASGKGNATDEFVLLPKELHEICMKNSPTDENYYYVDDKNTNYRFLILNTNDFRYLKDDNGQYVSNSHGAAISRKQVDWLKNEALKTDRDIIVFSHVPLCNKGIFGSGGRPDYVLGFENMTNGPEAYKLLKYDPNVMLSVSGHVHYDNMVYEGDFLEFTTAAALVQPERNFQPFFDKREYGTITETVFDVFSIKDDAVYLTRFGAGHNRVGCMQKYLKKHNID